MDAREVGEGGAGWEGRGGEKEEREGRKYLGGDIGPKNK